MICSSRRMALSDGNISPPVNAGILPKQFPGQTLKFLTRSIRDADSTGRRLLLGYAVERSQAKHEIAAGNADDFTVGKQASQRVQGRAVVRIVERRHDHEFIDDIKIRIARRKPLPFEINGRGHRQAFDAQWLPSLILHRLKEREIFLEWGVVGVVRIVFHYSDDGGRVHEAREIVDVAMRIVAGDSVLQPEDVGHSEIVAEELRVIFFGEYRIYLLHTA